MKSDVMYRNVRIYVKGSECSVAYRGVVDEDAQPEARNIAEDGVPAE